MTTAPRARHPDLCHQPHSPDALEQRLLLSTTTSVAPLADAYVTDGTPNGNFGTSSELRARKSATVGLSYNTFLKFDLSTVIGNITSIKVNLYGNLATGGSGGSSLSLAAYPVPTTTWGEGSITWNNQPAADTTALATTTVVSTSSVGSSSGAWYSWDISDYARSEFVGGDSVVSVAIKGTANSTAPYGLFNSKEAGSNQAYISVTTDDTTVTASDDAYVSDANVNTNYGTNTALTVQAGSTGSNQITYLKFNTAALSGALGSAVLYVYGNASAASSSIPVRVYPVADTSWSQSTVTWANKPAIDETTCPLPAFNIVSTTPAWYAWDLTEYVREQRELGHNTVSLALKAPSNSVNFATFRSKELGGTTAPRLILSPQAPPGPGTVSSDGQVRVFWQPVFGATKYHVLRGQTFNSTGDVVDLTPGGITATTYTDTSVTNGTVGTPNYYYYVIEARNAADVKIPLQPDTPNDCWSDPVPPQAVGNPIANGPPPDPNQPTLVTKYKTVFAIGGGWNLAGPVTAPGCDANGFWINVSDFPNYSSVTLGVPQFRAKANETFVGVVRSDVFLAANFGWKAIPVYVPVNCADPNPGIVSCCLGYIGGYTAPTDPAPWVNGTMLVSGGHSGGPGMGALPSKGQGSAMYDSPEGKGFARVKLWNNAFVNSAIGKPPNIVDTLGAYVGMYLVTYQYTAPGP